MVVGKLKWKIYSSHIFTLQDLIILLSSFLQKICLFMHGPLFQDTLMESWKVNQLRAYGVIEYSTSMSLMSIIQTGYLGEIKCISGTQCVCTSFLPVKVDRQRRRNSVFWQHDVRTHVRRLLNRELLIVYQKIQEVFGRGQ